MSKQKSWLSNSAFRRYALPVIIITFLFQYFGNFIVGDSYNIFGVYLPELGISTTQLATGYTIGGIVGIFSGFLVGTLMGKKGPRIVCAICIGLIGLGQLALALWTTVQVYTVVMILTRGVCCAFTYGLATLSSNWFINNRGRVLGINTMGGPLATATALSGLTLICATMGFKQAWTLLGILVMLLAAAAFIFVKDKPEDVGLQPDGVARTQEEIDRMNALSQSTAGSWTPKKIFSTKQSWLAIIGTTCLNFTMGACMMFFVPRMLQEGVGIASAVSAMSIGGLCAIPMSYFYGWLDDKINTPIAMMLLQCVQIITILNMIFTNGSTVSLILGGFCVANLTGALPNLHPSINAHVYGRNHFMYCHKYSCLISNSAQAFQAAFMAAFIAMAATERVGYTYAYAALLVIAIVALICFFLLDRKSFDEKLAECSVAEAK